MRWILFVVLIFGAVSWGQESKGYSDGNDLRNSSCRDYLTTRKPDRG